MKRLWFKVKTFVEWIFIRLRHPHMQLTPSGQCLLDYCRLIVSGEWTENDYIKDYDDQVERLRATFRDEEGNLIPASQVTRKEAAACCVYFMENLNSSGPAFKVDKEI